MKLVNKATKKEINMPVDYKLQERILRYFIWGMGFFYILVYIIY